MLTHGRLIVTQHGLMLDEVKSLLQKSLRRQEHVLTLQAAKELIGDKKDQLKWQHLVTFMFEDHCLNHVTVFEKHFDLYKRKDKFGSVELLSKCYTCRHSACLQVVAISFAYRNYETIWDADTTIDESLNELVNKTGRGINCDLLLMNIVKRWRKNDVNALTSLFGLVNMAANVEGRTINKAGMKHLIDEHIKAPNLYHLVLSILYHRTTDEYMKRMLMVCFRLATIPQTPQGLILFTVLSQMNYKNIVINKQVPDIRIKRVDWRQVKQLDEMPGWAVDKHTYRGKFGKSSRWLFVKKFKHLNLSEERLAEFHGDRPKSDIRMFFDVGCVCRNDILPHNPIWEVAKNMYLSHKPSLQKCAKMTKLYYNTIRDEGSVILTRRGHKSIATPSEHQPQCVKRTVTDPKVAPEPSSKKRKLTKDDSVLNERVSVSSSVVEKGKLIKAEMSEETDAAYSGGATTTPSSSLARKQPNPFHNRVPSGPLLQLPTGSGKVYTTLDIETQKVWKGPYKSLERQNLCMFLHRAMKEVFDDAHTMEAETRGQYIIFPLLKSTEAEISITHKAFYDCISKQRISEKNGKFVERSSLGIIQLHKLLPEEIRRVPVTVWVHFAWRFILNVGDTGLYNAIATNDLAEIFGIDMEEKRKQVKGSDVIHMMFGKLPRKEIVKETESFLLAHVEEFYNAINKAIDYEKLENLYTEYGMNSEVEVCKERLVKLKNAVENMCKIKCGI